MSLLCRMIAFSRPETPIPGLFMVCTGPFGRSRNHPAENICVILSLTSLCKCPILYPSTQQNHGGCSRGDGEALSHFIH